MRYRVFAYGGGSFENVERKLLVEDDFDSSEKILDPGKYLDGDVYISSEFEIQKYIKTKDIVIFWSYDYQLYFGPFLNSQRDGVEKGMIFLPRKGWFSHDCGGIFIDHHSDDSP